MKILTAIFILFISSSAFAQMTQAEADSICFTSAYVTDKDPKGLNVRSKPNVRSKKVGTIAYNPEGTIVDLIGFDGKWVKIRQARNMENDIVFSKTGWVYSPLLGISTRNPTKDNIVYAYEAPSLGNEIIAGLPVFSQYKLEGCFESWLKITIKGSGEDFSGWLPEDSQCDIPGTNCS